MSVAFTRKSASSHRLKYLLGASGTDTGVKLAADVIKDCAPGPLRDALEKLTDWSKLGDEI